MLQGIEFVAPRHEHRHLPASHRRRDILDPIIRILETLDSYFGNPCRLHLLFGDRTQALEVIQEYSVVDAQVAVHAHEVHVSVPWPAIKEIALRLFGIHGRGNRVDERVHTPRLHSVHQELPQAYVFRCRGAAAAPPAPRMPMLMEWPENDGNLHSVAALEALGQVCQVVQPAVELDVGGASILQDFGRHLVAGIVPGITAGERVVKMHAGHHHHSAVVGFLDCTQLHRVLLQSLERNFPAVHEGCYVHCKDAGIVPAHILGLRPASFILPLAAVYEVVLMPVYPPLIPHSP